MRVFVSHNERDADFARELRQEMKAAGLDVWDPDLELLPGVNWLIKTGRALERADAIVFLASAEPSVWTRKEVEYAIGQQSYEGRVITVRLTPKARIPWILNRLVVLDGSDRDAAAMAHEISRKLVSGRNRARRRKPLRTATSGATVSGARPSREIVSRTSNRVARLTKARNP